MFGNTMLAAAAALLITTVYSNAAVVAGWNSNGLTSFGPNAHSATTVEQGITVGGLTRGEGLTTSGNATANAWGGSGFNPTTGSTNALSVAEAVANNDYFSFSLTPQEGYSLSLSSINFDYRRST